MKPVAQTIVLMPRSVNESRVSAPSKRRQCGWNAGAGGDVPSLSRDEGVDASQQAGQLDVGGGRGRHQVVVEPGLAIADVEQAADHAHALVGQAVQIEGDAARVADQLQRRLVTRDGRVVDLFQRLVEQAHPVEPPEHVVPAIVAWHAGVATDRNRDRPAGTMDFVRQLDAGGRGAHDEHAALGKVRRAPVVPRYELPDVRRHARRH